MNKRSKSYWQRRFEQVEQSSNFKSQKYVRELRRKYAHAQTEIESKIEYWLKRLADNNKVSVEEARRILNKNELKEFKWTLEKYIERGRQNSLDGKWVKQLENASARVHIRRYQALQIEIQQQIEELMSEHEKGTTVLLKDTYKDTYYRSMFELQKGTEIGFNVVKIDEPLVDSILKKPWAISGENYSDNIWKNKTKLINTLNQEVSRMILTGANPEDVIERIIPLTMDRSRSSAERLVFTEQAYFTTIAQKKSFSDLGLDYFEVLVTFDDRTCDICGTKDDKPILMRDQEIGVNAPPFHPRCRCTTAPYFEDQRDLRLDDRGNEFLDMSYKEWKDNYGLN